MYMNAVFVGKAGVKNSHTKDWPQSRNVMGDGSVRIRNTGEPFEIRVYEFPRLTVNEKNLIVAVAGASAESGDHILFNDEWGFTFSAYIWGKVKWKERLGRFYSVTMTLRIKT